MSRSQLYFTLASGILCLSPIIQAKASKPSSGPCSAAESSSAKESVKMNSPLLQEEFYPQWMQMDIQEAPALMRMLIEQANAQLAEISQLKAEEMNYENTFGAFEESQEAAKRCYMSIILLSSINDSLELRKLLRKTTIASIIQQSRVINNETLWKNLKTAAAEDWYTTLNPAKKRYIDKTLNSFEDNGSELSPAQKKRSQEIRQELNKLQFQFAQNIQNTASPCFIINEPAQLAGMSAAWMDAAAKQAQNSWYRNNKKPQWLVSDYEKILNHCDYEDTRRRSWLAISQLYKINEPLIYRIAQLRQELAELLGFENFANFQTKRRMIGSEPNMRRFIEGVSAQLKPAFDKECAEFLAFISEKKGEKLTKIAPWDQLYYLNLLKEEEFQFNAEELRAYFPHEQVTQGIFRIFEQLFDIRFKEKASYYPAKGEQMPPDMAEIWKPEVKIFELFDASSNKHLGSFYLDIFQRNRKSAGAWMMPIRRGDSGINGSPYRPHLATLSCNFSRPASGKQALLSHDEVRILIHEMGHILHLMLSETELRSQTGTDVAWDFIEFPSQFAEYWIWTSQGLDIIASHHETGAKIPDKIKKQLLRSKHPMPAMENMEQLSLARIDLELHSRYDKLFKGKSLDEAADIILKDMRLPFNTKIPVYISSLTHFINGEYQSGYYGYKWGANLAADAFSRFLKDGILNQNTGKHFRETVLSKGDSAPAMELFKNFMGREPNNDALLEQQGILPAKDKNN